MAENGYRISSVRLLAKRLGEYGHSLKERLPEESELAQHAYEDGHRLSWNETRILDIES
jgi:hypothetical protein